MSKRSVDKAVIDGLILISDTRHNRKELRQILDNDECPECGAELYIDFSEPTVDRHEGKIIIKSFCDGCNEEFSFEYVLKALERKENQND